MYSVIGSALRASMDSQRSISSFKKAISIKRASRRLGGVREVRIAQVSQASVACRESHVGHQAKLLGSHLRYSPGGGESSPQMLARTIAGAVAGIQAQNRPPVFARAVSRRLCARNSRLSGGS